MKKEEILKKAIEKAVKVGNGFGFGLALGKYEVHTRYGYLDGKETDEPYILQISTNGMMEREIAWQAIVFRHDFAKAFWGEKIYCPDEMYANHLNGKCEKCLSGWKHHLKQMVISEDPISYLEKYL